MKTTIFVALVIAFIASASASSLANIETVSPTWGYASGGQMITISGCAFSTYSEVACYFDHWIGETGAIVDDNTIICVTPRGVDWVGLPHHSTVTLVFDGSAGIWEKFSFYFGPGLVSFAPTMAITAGGGSLVISGHGFADWASTDISVYLDYYQCGVTGSDDNSITCSIPAGEWNENAMVDIYFGNNVHYYLHSMDTFHFGPIFTTITPTFGRVHGGDVITLSGLMFNDPLLMTGSPRVEFTLASSVGPVGGWFPTKVGNTIVVTTPFGANFGELSAVTIFGDSPRNSRVPSGPVTYLFGPLFDAITPTIGYVLGQETLTVFGHGFNNYTGDQITVLIGGVNPCLNASFVNIAADGNSLTCTSAGDPNCYTSRVVTLEFENTLSEMLPYAWENKAIMFWWGPYFMVNTFTPTRGPVAFNNTVTVQGLKIARSPTQPFDNPVCNWDPIIASSTTPINVNSQATVTCRVPPYQFNIDYPAYWTLGNECGAYPNIVLRPNYHWGPLCTAVAPTFGFIAGGKAVSLVGVGFDDPDWPGTTTGVAFCLEGGAPCNWEQYGANLTAIGATGGSTITPNFAEGVNNGLGANRYFGDNAFVRMYFDRNNFNTSKNIICQIAGIPADYRYGPIVTDATLLNGERKSPMGPRGPNMPGDVVVITGAGFSDPLVTENIRVSFGTDDGIHGYGATSNTDTQITVNTLWGGVSKTDVDVLVYFDTCNTTIYTDMMWYWGPVITSVAPIYGYNYYNNKVVTIHGTGFDEYLVGGETHARCRIDGEWGSNTTIVSDGSGGYYITCDVPWKQFGTQCKVEVAFDLECRGDIDSRNMLYAGDNWNIYYRPNITDVTPTFGYTSGGQTVTIAGLGLGGWNENMCFFGHYAGSLVTGPSSLDDSVVCTTPSRRADFDQNVTVHVQMELGVAGRHAKWWAPKMYHYGPICSALSPAGSVVNPNGVSVIINGAGFADSETFDNNNPVVQWDGVNVTVVGAGADGSITVNNLPASTCTHDSVVSIWWDIRSQVIYCPLYRYGPVVVDVNPKYGCAGDVVTISGSGFTDPTLFVDNTNVHCSFGTAAGTVTGVVSDNSILCIVPSGVWQSTVSVVVSWTGANQSCVNNPVYTAGSFKYGPTITGIIPTRGYIQGNDPVTIVGFGFQSCAIFNATCRFGGADYTGNSNFASDSAVICASPVRNPTSVATAETDVTIGLKFNNTLNLDVSTILFHYGPIVGGVSPTFGRIRGDTTVVVSGWGFNDPWFLVQVDPVGFAPNCTWTPSVGSMGTFVTKASSFNDFSITCNSPDHRRECQDVDAIGVSWFTNLTGVPAASPFFPKASTGTHYYGPVISGFTAARGSRGFVAGGEAITISATNLDEWDGRQARCIIGNRQFGNLVTINNNNEVVCTAPKGAFNYSGAVGFILDPKNDGPTTLAGGWHWIPYVSGFSRSWTTEDGYDQITVKGGGFCNYDTVVCAFGGNQGEQSDVTFDDHVTCSTPRLFASRPSVKLTFCDQTRTNSNCTCLWKNTKDAVTASQPFVFIGVSSLAPIRGPYFGGNIISFTGEGFENVGSITCHFGSVDAAANITSGSAFTCSAPPQPAGLVVPLTFTLFQTYTLGVTFTFTLPGTEGPKLFYKYEVPTISSISPATGDIDSATTVTITGDLLDGQGSGADSAVICKFGSVAGTLVSRTATQMVCTTPSYSAGGLARVGPYNVYVSLDSGTYFTREYVPYSFTQNPTPSSITPNIAGYGGGITVTITGTDFNGGGNGGTNGVGSTYFCKFGNVIVGPASYTALAPSTTTTGSAATTASASTGNTTAAATTGSATTTAAATTGTATTASATTGTGNTTSNTTSRSVESRASEGGNGYTGQAVRSNSDSIVCIVPGIPDTDNDAVIALTVSVSVDGSNFAGALTFQYVAPNASITSTSGFNTGVSSTSTGGASTIAASALLIFSALIALLF